MSPRPEPHHNATPGYWVILNHYFPVMPFFPATTIHRNDQGILYTDFGVFPTMLGAHTVASGAVSSIHQLNQSIRLPGPTLAQLKSCVDIRKVHLDPDNPTVPFCGCDDALFSKEDSNKKPAVRLPPKPEYRAPTSDNLLLDQVVASSRGWLEEDEGWSTTKETPAIQDLQNPPPKSIRAPLFPEEGEGWATTRETLWPRRNEPTVRANQLQNSMFKTTPLWSQEGQGWATSREELLPSPIESNVNDAQYARSHKTSHAGNANRYPNYGD